jgi:tRNA1Val (adenine37-N6)-methyltransferase
LGEEEGHEKAVVLKKNRSLSNSYFQFKQFRIEQGQTAMKVCTDSCILGAWTPVPRQGRILDIGTGTGLLALMLAQRTEALIDALEIEPDACAQARQNVSASPWASRVLVHPLAIQDFVQEPVYDLIISNPPFYSQSLRSEKEKINMAYHSTQLSLPELLGAVSRLLHPDGFFSVLLPPFEAALLRREAVADHLHVHHILQIQDRTTTAVIREITLLSKQPCAVQVAETFVIKEGDVYSEAFRKILSSYYLHL